QVLARTAEKHGGSEALVFPQRRYRRTYADLHGEVRTVARALLSLGVQHGEHVGIWATNWPEWVFVQLAVGSIGAVLVNITPAYRASELEYALRQADITTLFLTDQFKTTRYFEILGDVCPELGRCALGELRSDRCPRLRRVISIKPAKCPGAFSWPE